MGRLSQPVLITDRLRLEPVGEHHLDTLVELNDDPAVMRHILGRAATRDETYAEWRQRRGPRSDPRRGLGYWVGHVDEELVGWWGLAVTHGEADVANLGYRLRRTWWGRGLATEGARGLITHGFDDLGVARVWASTMAVNLGSRRVLERVGMTHVDTLFHEWGNPLPGAELGEVVYEVQRPGAIS